MLEKNVKVPIYLRQAIYINLYGDYDGVTDQKILNIHCLLVGVSDGTTQKPL